MQAEAESVGKSDAAHEKLRTTLLLEDFLLNKGVKNLDDYRAQIEAAGDEAARTAEKLARARITDQIGFDRKTAFLTQEDVSIAQQLRGIYPDVATALNSVEASAMRANNAMRELSNLGQDVNRSFLVEIGQNIRNGVNAWDAFKNAGVNALGKIADKLMQMAADNLWKSAFGGASGSLLGGLGSLLGFGGSAGSVGVVGAAGSTVVPTFFHGGGVVGYGGYQRGAFPMSMFERAPRYHLGVDEVPAILQRGERVIPRGQNDNRSGSTVNVSMPISVNASGSDPSEITKAVRGYVNSPDFDAKVASAVIGARKRNVKI